jgi:hypothetical protein
VPDDATVITLLPRIFNAYLGTHIPLPDDRHFLGSQPETRLNLLEVPAPAPGS